MKRIVPSLLALFTLATPVGAQGERGSDGLAQALGAPRAGRIGAVEVAPGGLPTHMQLEPTDVGISESELIARLGPGRADELTVVFLNVGKGEHVDHVPKVEIDGEQVDALNANVRFLASLRPDFLVLAEVSQGQRPTLDAGTRRVLAEAFGGQLMVPSIWEFQETNNNAIFSRFRLEHVAGERREATDEGVRTRRWEVSNAASPSERLATVRTRWLDWTPRGATPEQAAEFRAAWGDNNYNTRAQTRVDFVLNGRQCTLFPVHYAMPWLQVPRIAVRDGFLVDGLQDHQLHRRGPLWYQIERAREDYDRLQHGRVVLIGDTNVSRHPRAGFSPLRLEPQAEGDGAPRRDTALAFELLRRGFHDAFEGDDETWTWPNPAGADTRVHVLPRSRIDNCLHGAGFQVVSRGVFFPRGADHGGLVVRLRLHEGADAPPPASLTRSSTPATDLDPPALEVFEPRRGALVGESWVWVRGRVRDPSGVKALSIDGQPVEVDADGHFSQRVELELGLNTLRLEARDTLGNRTRSVRSVGSGALLDADALLPGAVTVRLNRDAFRVAEQAAGAGLAALDLQAELRALNPLVDERVGRGLASLHVRAEVDAASKGSPTVKLTPVAGALRVRVVIPRVALDLSALGDPRLGPAIRVGAKLQARRVVIEAEAVSRVVGDAVVTTLRGTRVRLHGFHVDVRYLPDFVDRWISSAARKAVADLFARQVEAWVPAQIDSLLQAAQRPGSFRVAGQDVGYQWVTQRLAFDARGVTLTLAARASAGAGVSLGTPGSAPDLGAHGAVGVALDDDLLNRVAHVAWKAGLLDQRFDLATAEADMGAPDWVQHLNAGVLAPLFPDSLAGIDARTPLRLEVRPLAAPLARPRADGSLELSVGDVEVTLSAVPVGAPAIRVLGLFVTASVSGRVEVDPQGLLTVETVDAPSLLIDVTEGASALRAQAIEALSHELLPPVIERLLDAWEGVTLPSLQGLPTAAIELRREGQDRLGVWWSPLAE